MDLDLETTLSKLSKGPEVGQLIENASMAEHTSFKAGGKAEILIIPDNIEQLRYSIRIITENRIPYYIMGNGTNILVRDGGFYGVIVKIGSGFSDIKVNGHTMEAGAGALLKNVATKALESGLTGFEFASGIPGSIGGAAYMNAGAYDGDMSRVVEKVKVLRKDFDKIEALSADEMEYGYRSSKLMEGEDMVLSVTLKLSRGNTKEISMKMEDFNKRRREKQPLDYPSGGSFFKRPPGNYAGTLIQKAGLKGVAVGGAQVSELHAGFIINKGGATATDIINLMKLVQTRVYDNYGIRLEPEIRIIGQD